MPNNKAIFLVFGDPIILNAKNTSSIVIPQVIGIIILLSSIGVNNLYSQSGTPNMESLKK